MIHASIHGRLGGDPIVRCTKAGAPMVTASIAVNVSRGDEEQTVEWVNLAAFGRAGDELARHSKGDVVAVMGAMRRSAYTGRDGTERTSWNLTVEKIVSARTVRPGGRAKRAEDLFRAPTRPPGGPPLPQDSVDDLYADGAP
jgi:single-strand DNA-binding protein